MSDPTKTGDGNGMLGGGAPDGADQTGGGGDGVAAGEAYSPLLFLRMTATLFVKERSCCYGDH